MEIYQYAIRTKYTKQNPTADLPASPTHLSFDFAEAPHVGDVERHNHNIFEGGAQGWHVLDVMTHGVEGNTGG